MKIINLREGSSYTLGKTYIAEFELFLKENNKLPLTLKGETIIFDSYIIGSILIKDIVLNIQPRISNLSSNHYLEMQLYNEGILDEKISSLLSENNSFGVQENLIELFLQETLDLVTIGLEGDFIQVQELTNKVRGRILVENISPLNLLQDKIPVEFEIHTLNTAYNKIIKLALDKVNVLSKNKKQSKLYSLINSYFDDIETDISDLQILMTEKEKKIHFENKKYSIVLGLAEKILNDLKINLKNSEVVSSSYLINSNTLFESYVRKVLKNMLSLPIIKWDIPKIMGRYQIKSIEYIKSYSPDIIIDYHNDSGAALGVLDVKNKDISDSSNIGSLSDLYQIVFYSYSLDASYSGLVYPYYGRLDPTEVNVLSFNETNLFIFTIDFSKSIKERNFIFINDINKIMRLEN